MNGSCHTWCGLTCQPVGMCLFHVAAHRLLCLCVCACVCMCVCVCLCVCACVWVCVYVSVLCMCVCECVLHVGWRVHVCLSVHRCVCVRDCIASLYENTLFCVSGPKVRRTSLSSLDMKITSIFFRAPPSFTLS